MANAAGDSREKASKNLLSEADYIRRRRMPQAAFELQCTEKKVADAAIEYGYLSPTSFNRAFQSLHGITPAAAKSRGSLLNAYLPMARSMINAERIIGCLKVEVRRYLCYHKPKR